MKLTNLTIILYNIISYGIADNSNSKPHTSLRFYFILRCSKVHIQLGIESFQGFYLGLFIPRDKV